MTQLIGGMTGGRNPKSGPDAGADASRWQGFALASRFVLQGATPAAKRRNHSQTVYDLFTLYADNATRRREQS